MLVTGTDEFNEYTQAQWAVTQVLNQIRDREDRLAIPYSKIHLVACVPNIKCALYQVLHRLKTDFKWPFRLLIVSKTLGFQPVHLNVLRNTTRMVVLYSLRAQGCWWRYHYHRKRRLPPDTDAEINGN